MDDYHKNNLIREIHKVYHGEKPDSIAINLNDRIAERMEGEKKILEKLQKLDGSEKLEQKLVDLEFLLGELIRKSDWEREQKKWKDNKGLKFTIEDFKRIITKKKSSWISKTPFKELEKGKSFNNTTIATILFGLNIPRENWGEYMPSFHHTRPKPNLTENQKKQAEKIKQELKGVCGKYYTYFADTDEKGGYARILRNCLVIYDEIVELKDEHPGKLVPRIEYVIFERGEYVGVGFNQEAGMNIIVLQKMGGKHRIALRFSNTYLHPDAEAYLGLFSTFSETDHVRNLPRSGYEILWRQSQSEALVGIDILKEKNKEVLMPEEHLFREFLIKSFPTINASGVNKVFGEKKSIENLIGKTLKNTVWDKITEVSANLDPKFMSIFGGKISHYIQVLQSAITKEEMEYEIRDVAEFRDHYNLVLNTLKRDLPEKEIKIIVSSIPSSQYFWDNNISKSTEENIGEFIRKGGKMDRYFFLTNENSLNEDAYFIIKRHFDLLNQEGFPSGGNIYLVKLWEIQFQSRDEFFRVIAMVESGEITWEVILRKTSLTIDKVYANSRTEYFLEAKWFFNHLKSLENDILFSIDKAFFEKDFFSPKNPR